LEECRKAYRGWFGCNPLEGVISSSCGKKLASLEAVSGIQARTAFDLGDAETLRAKMEEWTLQSQG
jgi:hypothetical protein